MYIEPTGKHLLQRRNRNLLRLPSWLRAVTPGMSPDEEEAVLCSDCLAG